MLRYLGCITLGYKVLPPERVLSLIGLSEKVRRFSVSLPPALVDEFDETWTAMKYDSRSKAVHDAFRGFITETNWMRNEGGSTTGVVMILHYVDRPELVGEVNGILRLHRGLFRSLSQFFVGENNLLEVVAVEGDVREVRDLVQELMGVKGVKQRARDFLDACLVNLISFPMSDCRVRDILISVIHQLSERAISQILQERRDLKLNGVRFFIWD